MSLSFNHRHLYYLWVVAKEGSFTRAAERLNVLVSQFEDLLGLADARNAGLGQGDSSTRRLEQHAAQVTLQVPHLGADGLDRLQSRAHHVTVLVVCGPGAVRHGACTIPPAR